MNDAPIPARSRQGDPLTSDLAAASVDPQTSINVKTAVRLVLLVNPESTDEQLCHLVRVYHPTLKVTDQRIRTCRAEMAHGDNPLVVQAGMGRSRAGRKARTWRLA